MRGSFCLACILWYGAIRAPHALYNPLFRNTSGPSQPQKVLGEGNLSTLKRPWLPQGTHVPQPSFFLLGTLTYFWAMCLVKQTEAYYVSQTCDPPVSACWEYRCVGKHPLTSGTEIKQPVQSHTVTATTKLNRKRGALTQVRVKHHSKTESVPTQGM